jgi:hypothetical protein
MAMVDAGGCDVAVADDQPGRTGSWVETYARKIEATNQIEAEAADLLHELAATLPE